MKVLSHVHTLRALTFSSERDPLSAGPVGVVDQALRGHARNVQRQAQRCCRHWSQRDAASMVNTKPESSPDGRGHAPRNRRRRRSAAGTREAAKASVCIQTVVAWDGLRARLGRQSSGGHRRASQKMLACGAHVWSLSESPQEAAKASVCIQTVVAWDGLRARLHLGRRSNGGHRRASRKMAMRVP